MVCSNSSIDLTFLCLLLGLREARVLLVFDDNDDDGGWCTDWVNRAGLGTRFFFFFFFFWTVFVGTVDLGGEPSGRKTGCFMEDTTSKSVWVVVLGSGEDCLLLHQEDNGGGTHAWATPTRITIITSHDDDGTTLLFHHRCCCCCDKHTPIRSFLSANCTKRIE